MNHFVPEPQFRGWFAWEQIRARSYPAQHAAAFGEVGTYLLARFEHGPPAEVDIVDERVFYVGETHGRTRTLRARLIDFATSAGFDRAQDKGHYAAWEFPNVFPLDRNSNTGFADPSRVYAAVCPFPGGALNRATRGVFPTLIEQRVLWDFTYKHNRLPLLNNSGSQVVEVPPVPAWDVDAMRALFIDADPIEAAETLLNQIVAAMKYAPKPVKQWTMTDWTGVARHLRGKVYISIGWRLSAREVGIWVEEGDDFEFGGVLESGEDAPVVDVIGLEKLLKVFWEHEHSDL